jgi:hypothetical protein
MVLRNVLALLLLTHASHAYDLTKTLDSVSWAETRGVLLVGDNGRSLSHYQIYDSTWEHINEIRQKSGLQKLPHSSALQEGVAREMASTYLKWLAGKYESLTRRRPSPEVLYLMYTMGFSGAQRIGFRISSAPSVKRKGVSRFVTHYYGK